MDRSAGLSLISLYWLQVSLMVKSRCNYLCEIVTVIYKIIVLKLNLNRL